MHDSSGFSTGVGHVTSDTPPTPTVHGEATPQQGEQLLAIWNHFHDDYGVFCITTCS